MKKILKKDNSNNEEKIMILKSLFNNASISLTDLKPPEAMIDIEKFNASKFLKLINFKIKKMNIVNKIYIKKTFSDCFKYSASLNDKKFVNDFFKLLSKIFINNIIEKRKYKPPIHCEDDLHKINVGSKYLIFLNEENPVPVKPEIASKKELINVTCKLLK